MKRTGRSAPRGLVVAVSLLFAVAFAPRALAQRCAGCGAPAFSLSVPVTPAVLSDPYFVFLTDLDGDGRPDVLTSSALLKGTGRGTFQAPETLSFLLPYGAAPATTDFDRDGIPDLVFNGADGLSIAFGRPGGGFLVRSSSVQLSSLVVGDFDGDGFPDAVGNRPGSYEFVFLANDRAGGFLPPRAIPLPGLFGPFVVGDFNGDGNLDLGGGSFAQVQVLLGDGHGNFTPGASGLVPSNFWVIGMIAADFNADGRSDLLVRSYDNARSGNLTVFTSQSDGSFGIQVLSSGLFWGGAVADIDGDGLLDIVGSSLGISVFFGRPGGFAAERPIAGVGGIAAVAIGDVNGDGSLDIVGTMQTGVAVIKGDGAGWFEELRTLPALADSYFLATDDLNHDGWPDFVFGNTTTLSVSISSGPGVYATRTLLTTSFLSAIGIADVDKDGKLDIVAITDHILVFRGDGAGGFTAAIASERLGSYVPSFALGDFDGDGKLDIVLAPSGLPAVLMLGNGAGAFGSPQATDPGLLGDEIRAADLRNVGKLDLVTRDGITIRVSLGDGAGHFSPVVTYAANTGGNTAGHLEIGDVDGDHKLDIVSGQSDVEILKGDGNGGFSGPTSYGPSDGTTILCLADVNGDGVLDVVSKTFFGRSVVNILASDGAGGFRPTVEFDAGIYVNRTVPVDFDGDGFTDLVVAGSGDGIVLLNSNCVPRRLGISSTASCSPPGGTLSPTFVVGVYDDGDNVTSCVTGQVAASLLPGSGTPGASLTGTLTSPLSGGTTAFADLSIDSAGTGYVLAFASHGLRPTRSAPLGVHPTPAAPTAANDGPSCPGGTIHLSATTVPGVFYRWSGPNDYFSGAQNPILTNVGPTDAGAYSVKAVIDGCESNETSTSVVVLFEPSATITAPATVCPSLEALSASVPDAGPGAAYTWVIHNAVITSGQGTRQIDFTSGIGSEIGIDVSVLAADGCSKSGTARVSVAPTSLSGAAAPQLLPDGRAVSDFSRPGGNMYRSGLVPGHSYVLEVEANPLSTGPGPARPGLFVLPRFGATPTPFAGVDRSLCAPGGAARLAFIPDTTLLSLYPFDGTARLLVTDCFTAGYPLRVRLVETTLFAPRWSMNGYNAFAAAQSTCDCAITGQLVLLDSSGSTVTSLPLNLPANGSIEIAIPTGLPAVVGSALIAHDGPPGAVTAGLFMSQQGGHAGGNFRWPFVEVRSYGSADGR